MRILINHRPLSLPLIAGVLTFLSCKKEGTQNTLLQQAAAMNAAATPNVSEEGKRVYVDNIEELYAAVNDENNAGGQVILAPGIYLLDASYPNGGRLELRHNMSLIGRPGHPELVIIDATALPLSTFNLPQSPTYNGSLQTGAIRMGNGTNSIEWLTVQNDPNHLVVRSLIQTDLTNTPTTKVRIAHTVVKGSSIGISIINRDAPANGRVLEAEVEDNELVGNTLPPFNDGIQIQNSQGVRDASLFAALRGNYIHGNAIGLSAFNASSKRCKMVVNSYDDRFEENGTGLNFWGGRSEKAAYPTDANTLDFYAYGSTIAKNQGVPQPIYAPAGGVAAYGGLNPVTTPPGTVNGSKLTLGFYGCRFENNAMPYDINAWGAYSKYPSPIPAGSNNSLSLHLDGVSKNATVNAVPSFPDEPAGTNTVTVFR